MLALSYLSEYDDTYLFGRFRIVRILNYLAKQAYAERIAPQDRSEVCSQIHALAEVSHSGGRGKGEGTSRSDTRVYTHQR